MLVVIIGTATNHRFKSLESLYRMSILLLSSRSSSVATGKCIAPKTILQVARQHRSSTNTSRSPERVIKMVFNPDKDIPNLDGKVILVTGGNIGLGYESIYQLSKHRPSHIYLAARNKEKADTAIRELKSKVPDGPPITFLPLDLTSFESIKDAAKEFKSKSPRLDVLMLNAGIMAHPPGLTKEGYELQFGTNHVGHALFTKLLLPTLKQTATKPSSDVRVVTLSSSAHHWAPKNSYMFADVKSPMQDTSTWARYGQSKLANIHFSRSLARANPELKCISVHPGSVRTNLISGPVASYPFAKWPIKIFSYFRQVSVQEGALGQLWAATSPDAESGVFYYPVGLKDKDSELARDENLCKELWEWTEKELASYQ